MVYFCIKYLFPFHFHLNVVLSFFFFPTEASWLLGEAPIFLLWLVLASELTRMRVMD
jgi:hypothetical protein